jgi:hypothetical protein
MRLIILESPYAPSERYTLEEHIEYARACVLHSLRQGEAPIASHLLYTQPGILRDSIGIERAWGISAGLAWLAKADASVFYCDLGISRGMEQGLANATRWNIPTEQRLIGWPK